MDEYFVEEKTKQGMVLDFLVFLAVFVVTIFLILEILGLSGKTGIDPVKINEIYLWVSVVVLVIFVVDLIRLRHESASWSEFFKHYWLDVLATIPFELIALGLGWAADVQGASKFAILKWFRVTKLTGAARLSKVSRISKIGKEFKAAAHLKKESEEYQKKNRL